MKRDLNVLMLAYYFPPDSSSGSFRPLYFANYLVQKGLGVTILTARENDFLSTQPKDPKLLRQIDPRINIIRTGVKRPREALISVRNRLSRSGNKNESSKIKYTQEKSSIRTKRFIQSLKDMITDVLASPDPHVGWIPGAVREGIRQIQRKKIKVIYSTGSPWSCLLAGSLLSKKAKMPLILDFRDPWVSNPNFELRTRIARSIESKMELWVLKMADTVIANTDELKQDFLRRYPFLFSKRVVTINNGFENYVACESGREHKFTLVHAGSLYFKRDPAPLLYAIGHLLDQEKIDPREFRVDLLGGIETGSQEIKRLLEDDRIREVVRILPRISYDEAIHHMKNASVLLLVQPGFPLQIPRKLFDYLAFKKPVLAITDRGSATAKIMEKYNLGKVVPNTAENLELVLEKMYRLWKEQRLNCYKMSCTSNFLQTELSRKLYDLVCEVAD